MFVLRVWLTAGALVEHIYRGKTECRRDAHLLDSKANAVPVVLRDDFGKETTINLMHVMGYQVSDYDAELEGAMEINNRKQGIAERLQHRAMQRAQLIGGAPNGRVIVG